MRRAVLTASALDCALPAKPLAEALARATSVVSARNTLPILANVLVETRRLPDGTGEMVLTTTDLDQSVTLTVPAEVTAEGAATVPARILADALKRAPKDARATLADEGGDVVLKYGRSRFKLPTLPAADFPLFGTAQAPVPEVGEEATFTLKAEALGALLEAVEAAISTEETRYYLCGVYLHSKATDAGIKLRAVATNGHVLSLIEMDAPEGAAGMPGVILPRHVVRTARALWDKGADLTLTVSARRIMIAGPGASLVSKVIDGTYPDYERVVPTGHAATLRTTPAALTGALERVTTVATERARSVKLALEAGEIALSARGDATGNAVETLEAEPENLAEGYAIGFNARYALDALKSLAGDMVEICMASPGDPMIWRNPAAAGALWVVMPLRVS